MSMIGNLTHAQVRNIMREYEIRRNTITVTYMIGGVHVSGCGYNIRVRNIFAVLSLLAGSGKHVAIAYSNEPIGSVAD